MDISQVFPSPWIRASDIGDTECKVTIAEFRIEEVGAERESKPVVYFKGRNKALILNKTNLNVIGEICGPNTDTWPGREIVLFATTAMFRNQTTQAIRVKAPAKAPTRAAANIKSVPAGAGTDLDDSMPF